MYYYHVAYNYLDKINNCTGIGRCTLTRTLPIEYGTDILEIQDIIGKEFSYQKLVLMSWQEIKGEKRQ